MEIFSSRLNELLKAANLKPAQAAKRAGITPEAIYQWQSGARRPSPESCAKLGAVLGVNGRELYDLACSEKWADYIFGVDVVQD